MLQQLDKPAPTRTELARIRKARQRRRESAGRICVLVDVHDVAVPEALVALGELDPNLMDCRRAVGAAISRYMEGVAEKVTRDSRGR